MIEILIAIIFTVSLEVILVGLSSHPRTSRWFSIIPAIFWMYFLPPLFIKASWVYFPPALISFSSTWLMPLALILMVAPANLKKLLQMGRTSFATLSVVYVSMLIGGILAYLLFRPVLGKDAWEAFAALAATWTGGTVNMLAVKEIVGLSESHFSVLVITDAFLSYGWMALLMLVFRWSEKFDGWTKSKNEKMVQEDAQEIKKIFLASDLIWMGLAILLAWTSHTLGLHMPSTQSFPTKALILLSASIIALIAAGQGWHRLLQTKFSMNAGIWLLYFVLMTMRGQADFMPAAGDFWIMAAGVVWLLVHGLIMIGFAKIFRVRLGIVATASQSAVGGVVSAPVVAALYDPTLISAAVLMGIFGNLVGTYLGLLLGHLIRAISQ